MANRLPVPEELLHLIEKREAGPDASEDRRSDVERRQADLGPIETAESTSGLDQLPQQDRRSQTDRRVGGDRRISLTPTGDGADPEETLE